MHLPIHSSLQGALHNSPQAGNNCFLSVCVYIYVYISLVADNKREITKEQCFTVNVYATHILIDAEPYSILDVKGGPAVIVIAFI